MSALTMTVRLGSYTTTSLRMTAAVQHGASLAQHIVRQWQHLRKAVTLSCLKPGVKFDLRSSRQCWVVQGRHRAVLHLKPSHAEPDAAHPHATHLRHDVLHLLKFEAADATGCCGRVCTTMAPRRGDAATTLQLLLLLINSQGMAPDPRGPHAALSGRTTGPAVNVVPNVLPPPRAALRPARHLARVRCSRASAWALRNTPRTARQCTVRRFSERAHASACAPERDDHLFQLLDALVARGQTVAQLELVPRRHALTPLRVRLRELAVHDLARQRGQLDVLLRGAAGLQAPQRAPW